MIQVTHPLLDRNMINARLDAVSEIAESIGACNKSHSSFSFDEEESNVTIVQPEVYNLLSSVLTTVGRSPDIQRGITRIFHRSATASEVMKLAYLTRFFSFDYCAHASFTLIATC